MMHPNSLYNAVFKPKYRKFNPNTDYFTVVFDTLSFTPIYQETLSKLDSWMNHAAFRYFHAETQADLDRYAVEERLSEITELLDSQIQNEPPARRFCILTYFDDENKDLNSVFQLIGNLSHEPRDVVSLMVCMSKRMSKQKAFLYDLAEYIKTKAPYVDLYLFSDGHTPYYRRALVQSICGAIMLYAEQEAYRAKNSKRGLAAASINQYLNSNISEDGRLWVQSLPDIEWSTVYFKYYDRQYDFLSRYLSDLCANLKQLDSQGFVVLLDEIYRSVVPTKDLKEIKTTLKKAISMMPYVIQSVPKKAARSLRDHFYLVYGQNGISAVDLTLKATLSGLCRYNSEEYVKKCCHLLFKRCSGFAEDNLYTQVYTLLEQYVSTLNSSYKGMDKTLKLILDEDIGLEQYDENVSDSLQKYVDKYVQMYLKQKLEAFWIEVLRQIRTYPDEYTSYCEQAKDYHLQLQELVKEIPTNRVYQFDDLPITPLTADEILTMDQNEERCAYISELYLERASDEQKVLAPENCFAVFGVQFDSHFYQSHMVEIKTESYTLCGCEYVGKYLVLIGGDEDV